MLAPLLTEADPVAKGEGSIDPLGTYSIADALATRLAPGVRERQAHPRFLTAMAVSYAICSEFEETVVAKDDKSEPWLVFEWYLVEGLVRRLTDPGALRGLPGREKAAAALRDRVPLSADRYLKGPRIYGFHGVYRTLARTLGLEVADRLGHWGSELLDTWAREQGLRGFHDSSNGPGTEWRRRLVDAIQDGLKIGAVARKGGWSGWGFFADRLAHHAPGKREAKAIASHLCSDDNGHRHTVLEYLVSKDGLATLEEATTGRFLSEKRFHQSLIKHSDSSLHMLLEAIEAYERFSRLLQDAFDDCLFVMSQSHDHVSLKDFRSCNGVSKACKEAPAAFDRVVDALSPFDQAVRFQRTFADVSGRVSLADWTELLLNHHRHVQQQKQPKGKAPWFERFDDGTYMIRPAYLCDEGGLHQDEYVHGYRTGSLRSFAVDLRMF